MPSMLYRQVEFIADMKTFTVETFAWKRVPKQESEEKKSEEEYKPVYEQIVIAEENKDNNTEE